MGNESADKNPDAYKAGLYSSLWQASEDKPYDEVRESEVTRLRFASAVPFIEQRLVNLQGERNLRLLDFGCADGHTAEQILLPFATSVDYYGSDLYPLDATQAWMRERGFNATVSDGGLSGIPGSWPQFDVIMALSCFQYITDPETVFGELVARLAPGGVLVAYFYDAGPVRRQTDAFMREVFGAHEGTDPDPANLITALEPLAELYGALRDATRGSQISIPNAVPELGIPAGVMPLQKFLIDHLVFAWAPEGATTKRIQWALAEMYLTGTQTYQDAQAIARMLEVNGLRQESLVSSPSGHLVVALKS